MEGKNNFFLTDQIRAKGRALHGWPGPWAAALQFNSKIRKKGYDSK